MKSVDVADPTKYPCPAASLHVPAAFQCHASIARSVFCRYVTGCHPDSSTGASASFVRSWSIAAVGMRSTPAPTDCRGLMVFTGLLVSTRTVCAAHSGTATSIAAIQARPPQNILEQEIVIVQPL